jgi:hypothetical protein
MSQLALLEKNLSGSQKNVETILSDISEWSNKRLKSMKQSFCSRFSKLELMIVAPIKKLDSLVGHLFNRTNHMIMMTNDEFKNLNQLLAALNAKTNTVQTQIDKINCDIAVLLKHFKCAPPSHSEFRPNKMQQETIFRESSLNFEKTEPSSATGGQRKIRYEVEEIEIESSSRHAQQSSSKDASGIKDFLMTQKKF